MSRTRTNILVVIEKQAFLFLFFTPKTQKMLPNRNGFAMKSALDILGCIPLSIVFCISRERSIASEKEKGSRVFNSKFEVWW